MSPLGQEKPILGIGLNHVQAIRDAMIWSIAGEALETRSIGDWLIGQGLNEWDGAGDSTVSVLAVAIERFRHRALGTDDFAEAAQIGSSASQDARRAATQRSGGGWAGGASFCVRAAFVQVLGALEQFELDTLKALLFHRPLGKGCSTAELGPEPVLPDVVTEEPEDGGYVKPPVWTWVKGRARGRSARAEMFKKAYDIDLYPHDRRAAWDSTRNRIAHGRAVDLSLGEYLEADAYVTRSMLHLADQCQTKQLLTI